MKTPGLSRALGKSRPLIASAIILFAGSIRPPSTVTQVIVPVDDCCGRLISIF